MAVQRNKISNELRNLIVQNYNDGKKESEIAQMLRLPKPSVVSILRVYQKEGRVDKKARGGPRLIKVTEEIKNFLWRTVDDKCDITLKSLAQLVKDQFQVCLSQTTVANVLQALHFTFKRIKVIAERSISDDNKEKRITFASDLQDLLTQKDEKNIIFIDEVGFNISMRSKYGRAVAGQTPVRTATAIRSRNVSICCAMNKNGNLFYETEDRAYNIEKFVQFIHNLMAWLQSLELSNCTLIMDNVPFHRNHQVINAINSYNHEVKYLPPYTQQFNPIENMFSKWKNYVRKQEPQNAAELNNLIDNGLNTITPEDCAGFFRNMLREMRSL